MDERSEEELYRLTKENNRILHSMRRNAFWGGILKTILYLVALGIPIWLYFAYLYPVVQQIDASLSAATGKKIQLEGEFQNWGNLFEQFKDRFSSASSSQAQ